MNRCDKCPDPETCAWERGHSHGKAEAQAELAWNRTLVRQTQHYLDAARGDATRLREELEEERGANEKLGTDVREAEQEILRLEARNRALREALREALDPEAPTAKAEALLAQEESDERIADMRAKGHKMPPDDEAEATLRATLHAIETAVEEESDR